MAKKNKFYVVWEGRQRGIFADWRECERQIKGYPEAKYKSFDSIEEAERALRGQYRDFVSSKAIKVLPKDTPAHIGKPQTDSIAVDAAWNTATGDMEYQGVYVRTGERLFHQGPFQDGTNNIGEFLALVHGLAYLHKNKSSIPIYSDSKTAMAWLKRKHANTQLELTPRNKPLFEMLQRAEAWLAQNTYTNPVLKWETEYWGENPADFGRK
ncbi:MAG: viroplasmin family protein [Runella sp.]